MRRIVGLSALCLSVFHAASPVQAETMTQRVGQAAEAAVNALRAEHGRSALRADEELAEVTNYIVTTWDEGQLPGGFEPYTPAEFAEARGQGLTADDVYERRSE